MPQYPRKRELFLAAIALSLALVYKFDLGPRHATPYLSAAQRAHIAERAAMHYAGTVAGCLHGGLITWTDPHNGASMGTFCDTHVLTSKAP
jgi:hypothetical protein